MQSTVLIEATSGTPAGSSVRLVPGDSIVIGRLPECDVADPGDLHLSRQHCRIEYRGADCILKNLSSNGTLVNGQPADEVRLRDEDEIKCSRLVLRVLFRPDEAERTTRMFSSGTDETRTDKPLTYTAVPCRSGLTLFAAAGPQPGPSRVLELLRGRCSLFAIVHFQKMGLPVPEESSKQDALFFWLPEEAAAAASPLVIPAEDVTDFPGLIEQAWGKDGLILLGTHLEHAELVERLRAATGYRAERKDDGMLGYCWPGVLDMMLQHQPAEAVRPIVEGITAVLVESNDSPGGWHLFADASFAEVLNAAGLIAVEPDSASKPEVSR